MMGKTRNFSFSFSHKVRPTELFQENIRLKAKVEEMEMGRQKSDETDGGETWPLTVNSYLMKVKVSALFYFYYSIKL